MIARPLPKIKVLSKSTSENNFLLLATNIILAYDGCSVIITDRLKVLTGVIYNIYVGKIAHKLNKHITELSCLLEKCIFKIPWCKFLKTSVL